MSTPQDTPPETPSGPPAVSRFEYNLLRIARFLLGHMPADQGIQLVLNTNPTPPPCLSAVCLRLLKDTFGNALIPYLVRVGGWRRDTYLRGDAPKQGRVWERFPLDERTLTLSQHAVRFLIWLTVENPRESKSPFVAPPDELTAGDELFFLLALDALRADPRAHQAIVGFSCFSANPFCRLMFPVDFCEANPPLPDFAPLLKAPRVAILECLQTLLAQRWARSENAKGTVGDWHFLRHIGEQESLVLQAFFEVVHKANRQDLASFVLKANQALTMQTELQASHWIGGLTGTGPPRLAERLDVHRAALAVPRALLTLSEWEQQARRVGYFDDHYQAAQLYKSTWERMNGELMTSRARTILESIEPLRTGGTA